MLLSDAVTFHARSRPDDIALVFQDTEISYRALAERLHRLANALADLAAPGDRVAILSENRPEYIDSYYGVPRAGMGLCFINFRLAPREITRILNDAEPTVLITEAPYLELVNGIRSELTSVKHVVVAGGGAGPGDVVYEDLLASASPEPPAYAPDPDDLAWLIYTSGTTGMPKGAMLSHRNLLAAVANSAMSWEREPHEIALSPWPLCHVSGYLFPFMHTLGNTIVLMRAYDPEQYLALIEHHQCTQSSGAPTMLNMLFQHPRFDDFDLSSLKRIGYGAAAMPAEVIRQGMQKLPGVRFITGFGMTELSGNIFYMSPELHLAALAGDQSVLSSVGTLMPLAMARVVDDEMNDVAVGQVGELVVQGDQVLTGYWRRPEANEEAFFGGWFHTGDLAKWDEHGNLYIVDRKKDMIITGGENVYSREVEEVLYTHPGVAEAAVIGLPDPMWGEKIVAVIQVRPGMTVDPDELIELCRSQLASYKKPKHVVFVDELPRNAAGKILKRELRDQVNTDV
jgi:acyl-CoA synthetase (AMP-forming)/AMP-acid ligase II